MAVNIYVPLRDHSLHLSISRLPHRDHISKMALPLVFISLIPLSLASPDCSSTCGNLTISAPFGMNDPKCYHGKWFEIVCKADRAYLKFLNLEITKLEISSCKIWVKNPIYSLNCKNPPTISSLPINMSGSPFVYSREDNLFVGVGCNTQALIQQVGHPDVVLGGCISICPSNKLNTSQIPSCQGKYCCATSLPRVLSEFRPTIQYVAPNSTIKGGGDCSYALIAEDKGLHDWGSRILSKLKDSDSVPAVLQYGSACTDSQTPFNSSLCATPCAPSSGPFYYYYVLLYTTTS